MRKLTCTILLLTLTLSLIACYNQVNPAQAATFPPSIISTDTIWTQEGSPYNLSGPTLVSAGTSLTIQAGATVNLNNYYLQVNGSLQIRGTSNNLIHINSAQTNAGSIKYTASAASWNEQSGKGCIIENAILNQTVVDVAGCSVKIASNSFYDGAGMMYENVAVNTNGGASTITGNHFYASGIDIGDNSSVTDNVLEGGIGLYGGAPQVSGNTISGGSSYFWIGRSYDRDYSTVVIDCSAIVTGNIINGSIIMNQNRDTNIVITGNTIYGPIMDGEGSVNVVISNNKCSWISLNTANQVTITGNLITGSDNGLDIGNATVKNNTIVNCKTAILINQAASPTLVGNNILNYSQYAIKLTSAANMDASGNWWGTTDTASIAQAIYDQKKDFNLGIVIYTPILTAANPSAPLADVFQPTPTQTPTATTSPASQETSTATPSTSALPSSTPAATPVAPELSTIAVILLLFAAALTAVLALKKKPKPAL